MRIELANWGRNIGEKGILGQENGIFKGHNVAKDLVSSRNWKQCSVWAVWSKEEVGNETEVGRYKII